MYNWIMKFSFHEKGIDCDVELTGSDFAVSQGAQMAIATVKDKFNKLIMSGKGSKELIDELGIVLEIVKGNIKPVEGKYLTVKRLKKKVKGLIMTTSIEWKD